MFYSCEDWGHYIPNEGLNTNTVGPRYMRGIGTPKKDSHIMNSHIKRPRMTDN
jgi:hypothetical protein